MERMLRFGLDDEEVKLGTTPREQSRQDDQNQARAKRFAASSFRSLLLQSILPLSLLAPSQR